MGFLLPLFHISFSVSGFYFRSALFRVNPRLILLFSIDFNMTHHPNQPTLTGPLWFSSMTIRLLESIPGVTTGIVVL